MADLKTTAEERAGLRAISADWFADRPDAQGARLLDDLDTLLAELARVTAPAEGEPLDEALRDAFEVAYRDAASECHANAIRAIYRLGVAHERAMQQPAQDRATDEELYGLFNSTTMAFPVRAGILAVAARVRGERCLVARTVGDQLIDSVSIDRVTGGRIRVRVVRRRDPIANPDGESVEAFCKRRSDVPATLARLLGEVSRG